MVTSREIRRWENSYKWSKKTNKKAHVIGDKEGYFQFQKASVSYKNKSIFLGMYCQDWETRVLLWGIFTVYHFA